MLFQLNILRILTTILLLASTVLLLAISPYTLLPVQAQTPEDRRAESIRLNNEGIELQSMNQFQEALEKLQQALNIVREIGEQQGEGSILSTIGISYKGLGNSPRALEFFQQALTTQIKINDLYGQVKTLNNIGAFYNDQGMYPAALDVFQQALAICERVGDCLEQGQLLTNTAFSYNKLGQYQKALEFSRHALKIHKEVGNRRGESYTLKNIGVSYHGLGQYVKALESFQQTLVIHKEIGDFSAEGNTLSGISAVYTSQGMYPKALDLLHQALAIQKKMSDRAGESNTLNNIGVIFNKLNQQEKALDLYQSALVIQKEFGDRSGEGGTLSNIGGTYNNLGQYVKALEFFQKALVIFQETGNRAEEGITFSSIGATYNDKEMYSMALEVLQQGLVIQKDLNNRAGEAQSLANIGFSYHRLGEHLKSLEFYQQALTIYREIGNRSEEGRLLNNIGARLLESGTAKKAETILSDAIAVSESLLPGLTDEHKVSLFEIQAATYRFQQTALVTQYKFETALEVAERGRARAFVELLAARINGTETLLPQLTANLRPNITQIKQIAKERNATLVEYSIIDAKTLYIWVVQPNGILTYRKVALPQQPTLTAIVDTSRESIGVRGRGNFKIELNTSNPTDRLKQLHQLLISPIADLLPTDPNAHVIFVPHGELFLVTFPALQDAKGTYLLEKHTILTAPAIQVLDLTRKKRQQVDQAGLTEALVVGNPTMPQLTKLGGKPEKLTQLPDAEREANRISDLLKTRAWTGTQATKATIVPKLSQSRIIHLATHGFLDDLKGLGTPGAIALAPDGTGEPNDGLLTANEILDLKLNAELVVLSACDTGVGKITSDSVIGLSRSLIIAGASSVIVSLWSVPDAPTADLMTEFYKNWKERKLDKAQALRQAMLTIMKRPGATPKDWAAFTLIGESR